MHEPKLAVQQEAIRDMRDPFQKRDALPDVRLELTHLDLKLVTALGFLTAEAKIAWAAVESCDAGLSVRGVVPFSHWHKEGAVSFAGDGRALLTGSSAPRPGKEHLKCGYRRESSNARLA